MKKKIIDWLEEKKIEAYVRLFAKACIPAGLSSLFFHYIFCPFNISTWMENHTSWSGVVDSIYWVIAPLTMGIAVNSYRIMMSARKTTDKALFKREYHKKMVGRLDVIIAMLAISIVAEKMKMSCANPEIGIRSIFWFTYLIYVMREVTISLDDPKKSKFSEDEIPVDWIAEVEAEEKKWKNEKRLAKNKRLAKLTERSSIT